MIGPQYLVEVMNKGVFILFSPRFAVLPLEESPGELLEESVQISLI